MPIMIARVREFRFIDLQNPHLHIKYEKSAKIAQKIIPFVFFIYYFSLIPFFIITKADVCLYNIFMPVENNFSMV